VIAFVPSIKRMFLMFVILKTDQLTMASEAEIVAQGGAKGGERLAGLLAHGMAAGVAEQRLKLPLDGLETLLCHAAILLLAVCEEKDAPGLTFNQTQ
jgi:hypothetical protein